ncbi:MAG: hypothetical protein AAGU74_05225 [Bacillota bacterium]
MPSLCRCHRSALYHDAFSLNAAVREKRLSQFGFTTSGETYSAVIYSIEAESLGRDEIIRIAEGIGK